MKIDSNWTLATSRTPGQVNEHGNYNLSIEPTYRAESAPAYNMQEESKSRPEETELTMTSREENYSNHSKGKYFLRNRFKLATH